ncbi:MAG: hypothetical protein J6N72_03780 [Psychrobacter sp.]|nr:hypothetical protein [Psychrobacter sp.]
MRKTTLFHAVLVSFSALTTVGCFNSESDIAAATLNANTAMDKAAIEGATPSIDDENNDPTKIEASATSIPKEVTSSPESRSAYADFMASSTATKVPTGVPEKGGVSHKPMNNGSVVLKKPIVAPANSPSYGSANTVNCKTSPSSFYCSDQYILQVQQSKNRIVLNDGSEVVLTPAFEDPTTYMLTYVESNKQAHPSGEVISDFGDNSEFPVRYARVNGEACFYAELYSSAVISSLIYNCYKPGEDNTDLGLLTPLSFGQQSIDSKFTSYDLALLPQSNYDSFELIMP